MEEKFSYTYSPVRNAQVEEIRRKYAPSSQPDKKLEELKKLDKACERPGMLAAIAVGLCGAIAFVIGMILMFSSQKYVSGIILGITGLLFMSISVPVYSIITQKRRERFAPEIIKLSEEIKNDPSV